MKHWMIRFLTAICCMMTMFRAPELNLQLFADGGGAVTNTTTGTVNAYTGQAEQSNAMSPGMKTYYDTELLENARDEAVYGQLGKQQALPANHGKTVEWRKWNTLPEPDKLQEGVIPDGKKFGQSTMNVGIAQYGEYVSISDQLELHHIDDVILGATEEVGAAMGKKADKLTRDAILAGSTNVLIAPSVQDGVRTEHNTVWQIPADAKFTPDLIARAVTMLKKQHAPYLTGNKYLAVIHPSVAYDLRSDPAWVDAHKYAAPEELFNGEIGELHGMRFVESNSAPVMVGDSLYSDAVRYLTVSAGAEAEAGAAVSGGFGYTGAYRITVSENLAAAEADYAKLIGQYILLEQAGAVKERMKVTGVDPANKYLYVSKKPAATVASGNYLLPGNGGAETKAANKPLAVYATMVFGRDAFGVVAPEGAGMEMIIKGKDQAGGPLNQFSTVGGKMSTGARVLYNERMLCIYSASSYSDVDEANWRED